MNLTLGKFWGILLIPAMLLIAPCKAQDTKLLGTALLDDLLQKKEYQEANSELQKQIKHFTDSNRLDSLYKFPVYIGKISSGQKNAEFGADQAEAFVTNLKTKTTNPRILYKTYLSLDNMYVALGNDQRSLEASKKALEYAKQVPDLRPEELGKVNYAIGGNYYALYELDEALGYFQASVKAYEASETVAKDVLADAYNGVAVCLWTLNKLDKAEDYFEKAIEITKQSNLKGYDLQYYIVAFEFNLALVIDGQGRLGEAIEIKKNIIPQLQEIIAGSDDEYLVTKSKRLLASAISNLAAFYHDTGHLTKAYEMLLYSYEKKKDVFEKSSPRLAYAMAQIALSEFELKEFDKSINTAKTAITNLKESPSRYVSVEADILAIQAKATAAKGEIEEAKKLFEASRKLFEKAYPNEFSREYLIFLRDYAQFLAENNETREAIQIANDSYLYVSKNGGNQNFRLAKEMTNLAEVYYKSGIYEKACEFALKGNQFLDKGMAMTESKIDSIQIEFERPTITLLEVRSLLRIEPNKNVQFYKEQIAKIDKAVIYLERRKTSALKTEDINNILSQYKELNNTSKRIHYNLYELTGDQKYLHKLISLHESGIYNRIRTQFNIKKNINFGNIPASVINRENKIKQDISEALISEENDISDYFEANEVLRIFLDSIKEAYPKYYQLRYATIEEPLGDLQKKIPDNTTVIRYLFIEDNLFAFVINSGEQHMISLDYGDSSNLINQLGENQNSLESTSIILYELYNTLWNPFENKVQTEKVIIIPDRELFNLSFESLTSSKISDFSEMATSSLLAQHSISYNYSLFLLKSAGTAFNYDDNYIAFAPEFSEEMKDKYKIAVTDSTSLDKSYITLLPQPFSVNLAKKYSKTFSGRSFLNDKSTKQIFKTNAKEHKIIHIGTHAESNNLTPEFSRLIFAKNVSEGGISEDNSLFTYEIYDYNLASNLTILTACETGKPTFEPGEGMISLAHAFNYAGSESMLTSLWKIDEKSSSEIIGTFYDNLRNGLSKDEALRQAKLTYIAAANGRTVAPNYWAGLILMGDASAIPLNSGTPLWVYILAVVLLLLSALYYYKRKQ
ncbi:MAG: CHAT domain-containing protein [Flavobacteriaceae bacterium]|nr:CHAT domain-containing protein [Flavobacteriaceae bacterium]